MKKKTNEIYQSDFEIYYESLPNEGKDKIDILFQELNKSCQLKEKTNALIKRDYEKALLYYSSINFPLDETLSLIDTINLGSFYSRSSTMWYPLDDAAKIYPISMKHGQMAVFRLSMYLKEAVVPEILQLALNFTVKRFPFFAASVKRGFFWHYLDGLKRRFEIEKEKYVPCQPLDIQYSISPAFRVIYFNNRISIEFFHILTDGYGGSVFLKALVSEYLRLLGIKSNEEGVLNRNEIPKQEEIENSFKTAEKSKGTGGFAGKVAVQMTGKLSRIKPCQILHFKINTSDLLSVARSKNATITSYIISKIFFAIKYSTDKNEGLVRIQVPVNMRKFNDSKTLRNFSLYCGVDEKLVDINNDTSLLEDITKQIKEKTSNESLKDMVNSTLKFTGSLKYIPLIIKEPVAKLVSGFFGDRIFSLTISNLGSITMPEEYSSHIDSMDFVLGTATMIRASIGIASINNTTIISISKLTTDPSFEDEMYRLLTKDGLNIKVEGSPVYESKFNLS